MRALINGKWRTLVFGQRRGLRGYRFFRFSEAMDTIYELRKQLHPQEVAAGFRESLARQQESLSRYAAQTGRLPVFPGDEGGSDT